MATRSKRVVRYSPRADADLNDNYEHTTIHWGIEQAERYLAFLLDTAQQAADGTISSRRMKEVPIARVVFAKWKKATYGHYIIFTEEADGIYVLRVLHGAMDLENHVTGYE